MNEIPTGWKGYYRASKRERWQEMTRADDYGTCWSQLLDLTADRRGGELLVNRDDPNASAVASSPRSRRRF